MKNKIKVGIPRGLLYFKYNVLWTSFLEEMGCEIMISPESNKQILEKGAQHSIDESCLSAKIYIGHVDWLRDKVDYLFVPSIASYSKNTQTCSKFYAMPDIVRNTFRDIKVITYKLDIANGKNERDGFIKFGMSINNNLLKVINAYKKAKKKQLEYEKDQHINQDKLLEHTSKLKILIVSHPYNIHDKIIGYPIKEYLNKLDVEVIYADKVNKPKSIEASRNISTDLYWTYNQEIIGALDLYKSKVDGAIFLTTFPCGPDSLVNDLCIRKVKEIPCAYILIDELQGEAGIQTRLESFVDIVLTKKIKNCKKTD
ncbi:MAG: hypothetical protein A2Y24_03315 [Clostridiales bacterium GWE2_32_10]|nr:MAG: hypothetical protein A2Y24_03315 [Clostridiales bacterium GWE2_32_10]HBY19661.1 hypothetical protein [Clostridiales bacterium]